MSRFPGIDDKDLIKVTGGWIKEGSLIHHHAKFEIPNGSTIGGEITGPKLCLFIFNMKLKLKNWWTNVKNTDMRRLTLR